MDTTAPVSPPRPAPSAHADFAAEPRDRNPYYRPEPFPEARRGQADPSGYDPWKDPVFVAWEQQDAAETLERKKRQYASLIPWARTSTLAAAQQEIDAGRARLDNIFSRIDTPPAAHALWAPLLSDLPTETQGAIALPLKNGGLVTIAPQELTLHGAAGQDKLTVETAVLHAKTQWGGAMHIDEGNSEAFKAQAWAFAKLHGVKVSGYKPTREARNLAETLTSARQAAAVIVDYPQAPPAARPTAAPMPPAPPSRRRAQTEPAFA